ncbi:hypothetical protein HK096_004393 [Nowakowskiella sp. JEL0078]|nr:hypothetical protein HK096_004393 [Nowakowskiella sp. JEL0078]
MILSHSLHTSLILTTQLHLEALGIPRPGTDAHLHKTLILTFLPPPQPTSIPVDSPHRPSQLVSSLDAASPQNLYDSYNRYHKANGIPTTTTTSLAVLRKWLTTPDTVAGARLRCILVTWLLTRLDAECNDGEERRELRDAVECCVFDDLWGGAELVRAGVVSWPRVLRRAMAKGWGGDGGDSGFGSILGKLPLWNRVDRFVMEEMGVRRGCGDEVEFTWGKIAGLLRERRPGYEVEVDEILEVLGRVSDAWIVSDWVVEEVQCGNIMMEEQFKIIVCVLDIIGDIRNLLEICLFLITTTTNNDLYPLIFKVLKSYNPEIIAYEMELLVLETIRNKLTKEKIKNSASDFPPSFHKYYHELDPTISLVPFPTSLFQSIGLPPTADNQRIVNAALITATPIPSLKRVAEHIDAATHLIEWIARRWGANIACRDLAREFIDEWLIDVGDVLDVVARFMEWCDENEIRMISAWDDVVGLCTDIIYPSTRPASDFWSRHVKQRLQANAWHPKNHNHILTFLATQPILSSITTLTDKHPHIPLSTLSTYVKHHPPNVTAATLFVQLGLRSLNHANIHFVQTNINLLTGAYPNDQNWLTLVYFYASHLGLKDIVVDAVVRAIAGGYAVDEWWGEMSEIEASVGRWVSSVESRFEGVHSGGDIGVREDAVACAWLAEWCDARIGVEGLGWFEDKIEILEWMARKGGSVRGAWESIRKGSEKGSDSVYLDQLLNW